MTNNAYYNVKFFKGLRHSMMYTLKMVRTTPIAEGINHKIFIKGTF